MALAYTCCTQILNKAPSLLTPPLAETGEGAQNTESGEQQPAESQQEGEAAAQPAEESSEDKPQTEESQPAEGKIRAQPQALEWGDGHIPWLVSCLVCWRCHNIYMVIL